MRELDQLNGGRAALVIDADNLGVSTKERFNASPDYRKIKAAVEEQTDLIYAYAYLHKRESGRKFTEMLRFAGYLVRERERKTNVDTFLLWEAIHIVPKVDLLVLGAGDEDYLPIIWETRLQGTKAALIGVEGAISQELERNADITIPMNEGLLYDQQGSDSTNHMKVGL